MTGRVPNVWTGVLIPIPAAGIALVLRLRARQITKMGWGLDDGLAVAAWILAIGYSIDLIIWLTHYKLGEELDGYTDQQRDFYLERSRLMLWISEFLYAWSIVCSKGAVLWFYRRVFTFSSIRVPIIILLVCCAIWIILRTFLTLFRCIPVQAAWDHTIDDPRCVTDVAAFFLGTDSTHTVLDVIILTLPIYEVIRMRLPTGQKLAVIGLFASGFLVCIASVFQIIESQQFRSGSSDLTFRFALAMTWGSVEVHLAVFASSLALLRPIFRKLIPGLSSENSDRTSRPSAAFLHSPNMRAESRVPRQDDVSDTDAASVDFITRYVEEPPRTDSGAKASDLSSSQVSARHEEHALSAAERGLRVP